jgi:DNA-binding CsgD family transcriptional regulator
MGGGLKMRPADVRSSVTERTLFVGRDQELDLLQAQATAALGGDARMVRLVGPAGIGKSALARVVLDRLDGFRVVAATGEESEAGLTYGVLDQLLAGLAASSTCTTATSPLAAGAELVRRISDAQAFGPLLIWVDDLHWTDLPSQQALLFALRRLDADTVLSMLCVRSNEEHRLSPGLARLADDPRCTEVRLSGLPVADLAQLAGRLSSPLSAVSVQRLHDHTGGNPLWSRALLGELSPDQMGDVTVPLPAPRSFAVVTMDRLGSLGDAGRALVEACAAAGAELTLGALSTAGQVDDPFAALTEAADAGLVVHTRGTPPRVRTAHALVTAAVYDGLSTARRAALHTALSQVSTSEHERLRHEVAASPGHDAGLADRVAAAGREQGIRGAWVTAAGLLQTAAGLTPSGNARSNLLCEAAAAFLTAGDAHHASTVCDQLAALGPTPRTTSLLGWLAIVQGRHQDAETLLLDVTGAIGPADDPLVFGQASRLLGQLYVLLGRADEAVEHVRRAIAASGRRTPDHCASMGLLGLSLATSGQAELAVEELRSLDLGTLSAIQLPWAVGWGAASFFAGDWRAAEQIFAAVISKSHETGSFDYLCSALSLIASAELMRGAWDASVVHAEHAVGVVEDGDLGWAIAAVRAQAVPVYARRGQWDRAEVHASRASSAAGVTGDAMSIAYAGSARAVLEHSRRNYSGVLQAVRPILDLRHRVGIDDPGHLEWPWLYAEALVRLGHVHQAHDVLDGLERAAAAAHRPWACAAASRVRGLVDAARGRPDESLASFTRAARHAAEAGALFELALVHQQHGETLRRLGRRRAATEALDAALAIFSRLGATPFAEATAHELGAGDSARLRGGMAVLPTHLTAQELTVARLVRSGLRNRDIASALFISTKTVEFHLRNVFVKLGVSSRTQLVAQLAGD